MPRRPTPAWLPATLLLLASLVATAWLAVQPKPSRSVLAIFAPWWSQEDVLKAAGLSGVAIVGAGSWPNFLVVMPADPSDGAALYAAGAWLLLDPRLLAACAGLSEELS
ncbi:MAG TPA: hypothetical protein VHL31_03970 [Geminicoccus sp.]|uniref:hypothetical protein n=1 Tax=Geminicoccus sp. TaxID=2024832 RepID=UPI002E3738A7|nr:hypothetical protein [Geminicoccus sp.]HEX2525447.1 hypothetical protein [Geminicoccus sp.]